MEKWSTEKDYPEIYKFDICPKSYDFDLWYRSLTYGHYSQRYTINSTFDLETWLWVTAPRDLLLTLPLT